MKSEKARLNEILVAVSAEPETLIYRNNTGQAWQGERVRVRAGQKIEIMPGMILLLNARPISFGLVGSGDAMGASRGRPVAIEVKTEEGRQEVDQCNFQVAWQQAGGLYLLVRSAEEAVAMLRRKPTLDELLS